MRVFNYTDTNRFNKWSVLEQKKDQNVLDYQYDTIHQPMAALHSHAGLFLGMTTWDRWMDRHRIDALCSPVAACMANVINWPTHVTCLLNPWVTPNWKVFASFNSNSHLSFGKTNKLRYCYMHSHFSCDTWRPDVLVFEMIIVPLTFNGL